MYVSDHLYIILFLNSSYQIISVIVNLFLKGKLIRYIIHVLLVLDIFTMFVSFKYGINNNPDNTSYNK